MRRLKRFLCLMIWVHQPAEVVGDPWAIPATMRCTRCGETVTFS